MVKLKRSEKFGFGCLFLVFGAILLVVMVARRDPETDAKNEEQRMRYAAASVCENAVRARLKAPAGAEFQSSRQAAITELDNGNYKISSYVDAQNSFGAKLRTPYTCLVSGREVIGLDIQNRR
jgi:hypothetical protein